VAEANLGRTRALTAQGLSWCGTANPHCPLEDGTLTRREAEQMLFDNVLPRPTHPSVLRYLVNSENYYTALGPTTPVSFAAVGHGVLLGRMDPYRLPLVNMHLRDALLGDVAPYPRPVGERNWMTVDSKVRQQFWPGANWHEGYYDGGPLPALDPTSEAEALTMKNWAAALPADPLSLWR
jgi:hypothetical protein